MDKKEYIERGALIEKLSRMIDYCEKDPKVNGLTALFQVADAVMDCTAADVVEVRRGEWVDTGDFELDNIYSGWKCSLCGHIFCGNKTNYCSACGARMDGERKEQT